VNFERAVEDPYGQTQEQQSMKTTKKPVMPKSEKQMAAQEALQTTWLLKGSLKNAQLSYLRVGKLLALVREKKMWETLGHPSIEDYAGKRLQLGRSSLFKYMGVYDWTLKNHPEWLQPKPKGFIPDLSDVANLIWIDQELARKNLSPKKKAALSSLQEKALTGKLQQGEIKQVRAKNRNPFKALTSTLLRARKVASQLSNTPPEVVSHLDAAITLLQHATTLAQCGIFPPRYPKQGGPIGQSFLS
jgi:hypothetical protein